MTAMTLKLDIDPDIVAMMAAEVAAGERAVTAAMRLGEAIYKAQASEGGSDDEDGPRSVDDDIVDADFEDLGDDKRRK